MISKLNAHIKIKSVFSIVILALVLSACKKDKQNTDPSQLFDGPSVINFLVNSEQLPNQDRINKDFTMVEYREDRMNKDHVLHVPIYDTIYFEDISQFKGDAPGKRTWHIDDEKLSSSNSEVAFYSEEVGPAIVTLRFDDFNIVQKGIFFTDLIDFENPTSDDEMVEEETSDDEMSIIPEDELVSNEDIYKEKEAQPIVETRETKTTKPSYQKPATSSTSVSSSKPVTSTTSVATTKPKPVAPPKKVEVQKVDFSVSRTVVEIGESISFKDMSFPSEAVNNQVWDWGDGNTMSIRRGAVKYSYLNPGTYTVKLCLNYSSKCTSKKITVKEGKKAPLPPVVVKKEEPKEEKVVEKPKPTVSKVSISTASKTLVGKPIEIKDETYPAEAVTSREWFINGEKSNLTNKRFSKTFDKAGTYNVKLCVNGGTAFCQTKTITVEEKPKPKPAPVKEVTKASTPAPTTEFFAMDASRSGLRSSQRCPDSDVEFYTGTTEITLTPNVRMELMNARIYGQKVGLAKVTLKAMDGSITRKINNVQILPGPSTIEFGDFGIILQAGQKYMLIIEPMSSSETVALENGGKCNTTFASDNRLAVSYKDNVMTLFDIKFGFE